MGSCPRSFIVRDLQSVNRTRTCDPRLILIAFLVVFFIIKEDLAAHLCAGSHLISILIF